MFKRTCNFFKRLGEALQPILLLAIRLYWGYAFFVAGYSKLISIEETAPFFASLGIPFPTANAYIAGGIECLGGLLLMVGLFSRIATIPLIVVMLVAYQKAHFQELAAIWSAPDAFVAASPFNFLLACLLILAFGPGKLSLDYLLCKLCFHKKCSSHDDNCSKGE